MSHDHILRHDDIQNVQSTGGEVKYRFDDAYDEEMGDICVAVCLSFRSLPTMTAILPLKMQAKSTSSTISPSGLFAETIVMGPAATDGHYRGFQVDQIGRCFHIVVHGPQPFSMTTTVYKIDEHITYLKYELTGVIF